MTTVTIGTYPKIPVTEKKTEQAVGTEELPFAEEREAPAPVQNQTEEPSEPEEYESVRVFSSPVSVRRRIPLRAVLFVQLLLAAGAGLFVRFGGTLGSGELRAVIAEAVRRALNG